MVELLIAEVSDPEPGRRFPIVPLNTTVLEPCSGVRIIRIDNVLTRLISAIGGG